MVLIRKGFFEGNKIIGVGGRKEYLDKDVERVMWV